MSLHYRKLLFLQKTILFLYISNLPTEPYFDTFTHWTAWSIWYQLIEWTEAATFDQSDKDYSALGKYFSAYKLAIIQLRLSETKYLL